MAHGVRSFSKTLFRLTVNHSSCVTFIPLALAFFYSTVIKLLSQSIRYADFNALGPFLSAFHTASSFHSFTLSHTASNSFPRTSSSVFCLSGTCWVYIFSLSCHSKSMMSNGGASITHHRFRVTLFLSVMEEAPLLIIDLEWHFSFPWPSWLSGMSGLGNNPVNRQMDSSSGGVGAPRLFVFSIFFHFFSKNLNKYDLGSSHTPFSPHHHLISP